MFKNQQQIESAVLLESNFQEAIDIVLKTSDKSICVGGGGGQGKPEPDRKWVQWYNRIARLIFRLLEFIIPLDIIKNDHEACLIRFHDPSTIFNFTGQSTRDEVHSSQLTIIDSDSLCEFPTKSIPNVHKRRCPLWTMILVILFVYTLYVTCLGACWHSKYQAQMKFWNPLVVEGANRTAECALYKDIYHAHKEAHEKLLRYRDLLENIGIISVPSNVLIPVYLSADALALISLMASYLMALFSNMLFECPLSIFITHPEKIRDQMRLSGLKLIQSILASKNNRRINYATIYRQMKLDPLNMHSTTNGVFHESHSEFNNDQTSKLQEFIDGSSPMAPPFHNNKKDSQNIIEEPSFNVIEPLCFKPFTRNIYIRARLILSLFTIFGWLLIQYLGMSIIIRQELSSRFKMRLRHLECELWNPNATYIRDSELVIYFEKPSIQYRNCLIEFRDGNLDKRFECYLHEFFIMASPKAIIFWAMLNLSVFIMGCWFCFDLGIFIDGFLSNYIWAHQVIQQLGACIRGLSMLSVISRPDYHKQLSASQIVKVAPVVDNRARNWKRMEAALVVSYCNYVLLRKWERNYTNFRNYFCFLNMSGSLLVVVLIYTIYNKQVYSITTSFLVVMLFMVIGLTNCIHILNLLVMGQFQKIHSLINNLVGKMGPAFTEGSYLVTLWRRQLLEDSEVQSRYSVSFLGKDVTRSALISLNSYVIAALIYLFLSSVKDTCPRRSSDMNRLD